MPEGAYIRITESADEDGMRIVKVSALTEDHEVIESSINEQRYIRTSRGFNRAIVADVKGFFHYLGKVASKEANSS